MVLIQESKLRSVTTELVNSIWGIAEHQYMEVDSEGSSGGIITIWHSDFFKLEECCSRRNFLLLKGIIKANFECVIVNIYGPCDVLERRRLWGYLLNLKSVYNVPWCIGGDLNEIRSINERQGCSMRDRGMRDLNSFIEDMELVDLQLMGRCYTWSNSQDNEKWSRIDRFLLDPNWLERFKLKQWGLPRTMSDHCPLMLMEDEREWGPKPFKFFNAWLSHPNCLKLKSNEGCLGGKY